MRAYWIARLDLVSSLTLIASMMTHENVLGAPLEDLVYMLSKNPWYVVREPPICSQRTLRMLPENLCDALRESPECFQGTFVILLRTSRMLSGMLTEDFGDALQETQCISQRTSLMHHLLIIERHCNPY